MMEFKNKDKQKMTKADGDDARLVNEEISRDVKPHYNQAWEIEIDELAYLIGE